MTNKNLYITLLAILGFNAEYITAQVQGTVKGAPRLVVSITIDQLRSDYMEAFLPLYSDKGLDRERFIPTQPTRLHPLTRLLLQPPSIPVLHLIIII